MSIVQGLIASISSASGGTPLAPIQGSLVLNGAGVNWATYLQDQLGTYPAYNYTQLPAGSNYQLLEFNSGNCAISPSAGVMPTIYVDMWFLPYTYNMLLLNETSVQNEQQGYHASLLGIDSSGYVKAGAYPYDSIVTSTSPIMLGSWNHIYFYNDGTTNHLELNGATAVTAAGSRQYPGDSYFSGMTSFFGVGTLDSTSTIGNNNYRFQGILGALNIDSTNVGSSFNSEKYKYQAQVKVLLDAASYPGTGVAWADTSGNNHGATLYNSPAHTATSPSYFTFDRSTLQYADIDNIGDLNTWTVETWVRQNGALQPGINGGATAILTTVYEEDSGATPHVINYCIGTTLATSMYGMGAGFFENGTWHTTVVLDLTPNSWSHLVATYNGQNLTFYVNGTFQGNSYVPGVTSSANGGKIRIARRWDNIQTSPQYWPGDISLIKIYQGALTSNEVANKYDSTRVSYGII